MADNNKIVTLGNIAILKDYINRNIEKASKMLNEEYDAQFNVLQKSITELENLGTLDELAKLQLELNALKANFEDKQEALEILKTDFENLSNGITDGTVFSAGQLNEIISTALIDETVITDDMVSTENVFTQKIVALIGNFGKINAGQVEAGTLKGSNIESTNKIDYTNDPVWRLNNNGSGWLANKNISWDENGNVTFGSGVSLDWSNIDSSGITTELEELSNKINNNNNSINELTDNLSSANNSINELTNNLSITNNSINNSLKNLQDALNDTNSEISTLQNNTTNNIDKLKEDLETELDKQIIEAKSYAETKAAIAQAEAAAALAAANGITLETLGFTEAFESKYAGMIGSKLTHIDANGIYSGTISADNFVGEKISGLTFESGITGEFADKSGKGPLWQINKEGSGYLARKNISWDADGNVNFGSNVKLSWGNITGTDKIATLDSVNSAKTEIMANDRFTNIGANGIYTGSIDADQITAGQISADRIDVDNLKVKKLNTEPEKNNDKIEISDNHLYCVNSDGKNNLIISSKEISTGVINALGDNQIGNEIPTTSQISLSNFIKLYDKTSTQNGAFSNIDNIIMQQNVNKNNAYQEPATIIIPRQSTGFKQQEIQELGTYFSGATIWVKPHLLLEFISNGRHFILKKDTWDISCSCVVKLYKKKRKNDSWENVTSYNTTGDTVFLQADKPYTIIKAADGTSQQIEGSGLFANFNTSSDPNRRYINAEFSNAGSNGNTSIQITPKHGEAIKQYASWIRFDIDETCIYGINIELETSTIYGKTGNNADNIPFNINQVYPIWISFNKDKEGGPIVGSDSASNNANKDIDNLINAENVEFNLFASYIMDVENNNKPASYTELGKDGVVVYDGRHLLSLYSDGVEMKANSDDKNLGTTFYGFKVTKDGLYYCNGGNSYTKWNPS